MDTQKRKNIILGSVAAALFILATFALMRDRGGPEPDPGSLAANDQLSAELAQKQGQNQTRTIKPKSPDHAPAERGAGKAPMNDG